MASILQLPLSNVGRLHMFSQYRTLCNLLKHHQHVENNILHKKKLLNFQSVRNFQPSRKQANQSAINYGLSAAILTLGLSFAAVPLYRVFCQTTGYGGTVIENKDTKADELQPVKDKLYKVRFNADLGASMRWNFRPQQTLISVYPGETALAFYKAMNPTDTPVIGISTYNVVPFEAGPYFNKIQCFCFDEQMLSPHEEVSMPVFFYLDPEIMDDPFLQNVDEIVLSYTFFESKPGVKIPLPDFVKSK